MECWVNSDKSITPILQHSNSPIEIVSYPLRHALCALPVRRGAAANENPPDRISSCCLPFRYLGPHRGIPAGSARAWVRGGEKHRH